MSVNISAVPMPLNPNRIKFSSAAAARPVFPFTVRSFWYEDAISRAGKMPMIAEIHAPLCRAVESTVNPQNVLAATAAQAADSAAREEM